MICSRWKLCNSKGCTDSTWVHVHKYILLITVRKADFKRAAQDQPSTRVELQIGIQLRSQGCVVQQFVACVYVAELRTEDLVMSLVQSVHRQTSVHADPAVFLWQQYEHTSYASRSVRT